MDFMQVAIDKAREGIKKGQTPFGACIIKDDKIVVCAHNTVWKTTDSTAHAEVNAIREACKKLKTIDLSGCTLYTTTEPCPMCFSAIHWAKIDKIVYGADIVDAKKAGFSELTISNSQMKKEGGSPVKIEKGALKDECITLFKEWKNAGGKTY
jgi:guanine deaminase